MRYEKVLLVNPPYSGSRVKVVFSAGLGYVAESLKYSGIEYEVIDMSLGYAYKDLKRKIANFQPQLIGISVMTYRYKDTYRLIANLKKDYPEIRTVVGGPHLSLFREKVLSDCPEVDYGVVLEGEETIVELCRGNSPDTVKGLIFRKQDNVVYNGDRPFIKNLDEIPFPRYEKFELAKSLNREINALPIVSSRGCPYECVYCPVKNSIGRIFRVRSPENIMQELSHWYDQGFRRFSFADDNFTLIKERVYKLCNLIKNSKLKDIQLSCDNGIRADRVDRDLLRLMSEVGFHRVAIGVEAGNDKVLGNLKKKENIATIRRMIEEACKLNYEVNLFFLVGSPGETRQDLDDSFRIALEYPIGTAYFYNIIPFPHTELFDWIEKNGRFLKKPEEYLHQYPILDNIPVFETPQMSGKERKKALRNAFRIMRKTMRKKWSRRLVKLGIVGKILAFVYTTKFVQDVVLRNKFLNRLVYKLAQSSIS